MFKKAYIVLISLLILVLVGNIVLVHIQTEKVLISNEIKESEAFLKIVTFGERIKSNKIYFLQWESLNADEKEEAIKNNNIFMFTKDEFENKENLLLINDLIQKRKTVLFYGYRINPKEILEFTKNPFPYYEISANQKIYHYMYGYGYSKDAQKMLPITIMGNMDKESVDSNLAQYLVSTYGTKKEKNPKI